MDLLSGGKTKKKESKSIPIWIWVVIGMGFVFIIFCFFLSGIKNGNDQFIGLEPLNPDETNLKTEDFITRTEDQGQSQTQTEDQGQSQTQTEDQIQSQSQTEDQSRSQDLEITPKGPISAMKKKKRRQPIRKTDQNGITVTSIDQDLGTGSSDRENRSRSVSFFDEVSSGFKGSTTEVISITETPRKKLVNSSRNNRKGRSPRLNSRSADQSRETVNHNLIQVDNTPALPQEIIDLQTTKILKQEPKGDQKQVKWKCQAECKRILEKIYGTPFIEDAKPIFLGNPFPMRNGGKAHNLELDVYHPELKIALEYQGPTHYNWPNWTGQTREQFERNLLKDIYKADKCDEEGVWLIPVPYNVPYGLLEQYIRLHLPKDIPIPGAQTTRFN